MQFSFSILVASSFTRIDLGSLDSTISRTDLYHQSWSVLLLANLSHSSSPTFL